MKSTVSHMTHRKTMPRSLCFVGWMLQAVIMLHVVLGIRLHKHLAES